MEFKINGTPYEFRYNSEEITFYEYLDIIDILNKDQYDTYRDSQGNEKQRREPRPKNQRSDEYIIGLYQEILRILSDIPEMYIEDSEFTKYCLEWLSPALESISEYKNNSKEISFESKEFLMCNITESDNTHLKFQKVEDWVFWKWCILETFMRNGYGDLKGNRLIIPMLFHEKSIANGETPWNEKLSLLNSKIEFFGKLPAQDIVWIYQELCNYVSQIRESYPYIYNSEGGASNSPALEKHFGDFGWLETLRSLVEKGIFGSYTETKNVKLFQVLEYLNTSISFDKAEAEAYKQKK